MYFLTKIEGRSRNCRILSTNFLGTSLGSTFHVSHFSKILWLETAAPEKNCSFHQQNPLIHQDWTWPSNKLKKPSGPNCKWKRQIDPVGWLGWKKSPRWKETVKYFGCVFFLEKMNVFSWGEWGHKFPQLELPLCFCFERLHRFKHVYSSKYLRIIYPQNAWCLTKFAVSLSPSLCILQFWTIRIRTMVTPPLEFWDFWPLYKKILKIETTT